MPLFQSEAKCEAIDMTIKFHSHSNKTHFNEEGFAFSLLLKVRVFGIQKIPISTRQIFKTGTCQSKFLLLFQDLDKKFFP